MGLEGTTKGVRAGVAHRAGHLTNAVSRIAEQLLGLGQPDFFQELVEGHARRLTEQGGEIGGVHLHGRGQVVQVDRAVAMLMHEVENRLNVLLGVDSQTGLARAVREVGQPMPQFPAQARGLGLRVVQPPQGVVQSASGHPSLGAGFQIVEDQTHQSHRVMEGGGGCGVERGAWSVGRYPRLQDQRERADLIHLKAGTEVGDATLPDEPPALVGRGQGWFPTTLQAELAALGLPAFRARSLARPRAQDGHSTGCVEVQRTMPQDVEAQTGQLGNKSEQRPGQPRSEQVLTLLEGEKLRGFGLCRPLQRRSLVCAWALGRGFGVRSLCPSRPCHRAAFHVGFHKAPKPGACPPSSICAPKGPG